MKQRAILLSLLAMFAISALAEEQPEVTRIKSEVQRLQGELADLVETESTVKTSLKQIESVLAKQAKSIGALEVTLAEKEARRRELDQQVAAESANLRQLLKSSEARLRVGYMYRSDDLLLRAVLGGRDDAARIGYLMSIIRQGDERQIKELRMAQLKLSATRAELVKALEEIHRQSEALKKEQEKQGKELQHKTEESARIAEVRKRVERTIASLLAQANRLESTVQTMLTSPKSEQREARVQVGLYQGKGLSAFRGQLIAPVRAKVVKLQGGGFDAVVLKKGVAFLADDNAAVVAVAPGRVVYTGQLPGYELVVIIDHGSRSHTLYGRLASISVALGDEVAGGDPIGVVGNSPAANFYFEVRQAGAPMNVKQLFGKAIAGL